MAITYFNTHDGSVLTNDTVAGKEAVAQGRAVSAEVTENVESWRMRYDLNEKKAVIYAQGKTEEEAIKQKEEDDIKKSKLEAEKNEIRLALMEKQVKEIDELNQKFLKGDFS